MAALFRCFGKKRREKSGCEGASEENVVCTRCKTKITEKIDEDGTDGRPCSKFRTSEKKSEDTNSQDSSVSSTASSLDANGASGTRITNGTNNGYIYDYTPMAQAGIPGMSYMPVSKSNPNYNMNHRRRGKAIIFNFDKWNNTTIPSLELPPRLGSEKDKNDLAQCLMNLSFEVFTYDNLAHQKFMKVLDRLRKEDHSDADCLVVAIMTHGEKNTVYLSDGTQLPVNLIWEKFEANKCPTMAGKPKLFIVQACRGKRYDDGTFISGARQPAVNMQHDVTDFAPFSYVIPNAADVIVAFSCPLGHYSWRSPEKGSWFIQSFCKVFNELAYDMDLKSLLTTVSREVALNYESDTGQLHSNRKKQVPSTSSTLIRNVIFAPKPFVPYQPPLTSVVAGTVIDSAVQTLEYDEKAGDRSHISLQEVQVALASVQSSTARKTEFAEDPNGADDNVLLGMVTVIASPQSSTENNESQISEEIPALVQSDDSNDELPLIPENPSGSPEQPILPCN